MTLPRLLRDVLASPPAALVLALPGLALAVMSDSPLSVPAFQPRSVQLDGESFRYAVYVPPGYDSGRAWPCVVFLHGSGECGSDGVAPTRAGLGPAILEHPGRWPFLVVFPQKPSEQEEWEERESLVLAVLAAVRHEFRVDSTRIALTGMSQGGHGTWVLGARHAGLWSCLAPICGYGRARTIAHRVARLPVWAFHGLKDDLVDPQDTQRIIEAIRAERTRRGLDPEGPEGAQMTLYPDANHNSWDAAYAEEDLPKWMLDRKREERR